MIVSKIFVMNACLPDACSASECVGLRSCSDCPGCDGSVFGGPPPTDCPRTYLHVLTGRQEVPSVYHRLIQFRQFYCSRIVSYCVVLSFHFFLSHCVLSVPPAIPYFGEQFTPGWIWPRYGAADRSLISTGVFRASRIYTNDFTDYDSLQFYTNVFAANNAVVGPRGGTFVSQCDDLRIWANVNCSTANLNPSSGVVTDTSVVSYFYDGDDGDIEPAYFTNQHQVTTFAAVRASMPFSQWAEFALAIQLAATNTSLGRHYLAEPVVRRDCMRVCQSSSDCSVPSQCEPHHTFSFTEYDGLFGSGSTSTLSYSFVSSLGPVVYDLYNFSIDRPFWISSSDGVRAMFAVPWCALSVVNPYCRRTSGVLVTTQDYLFVRHNNGSFAAIPQFCMFHLVPVSASRRSLPPFVDSIVEGQDQLCIKIAGYGSVSDAHRRCGSDLYFYPTIADVFAAIALPVAVVGNHSEYLPLFNPLPFPKQSGVSGFRAEILSGIGGDAYCVLTSEPSPSFSSGSFKRYCDIHRASEDYCIKHILHRRSFASGIVDDLFSSVRRYFAEAVSGVSAFAWEGLRGLFEYLFGSVGGLLHWFPFHAAVSFILLFVFLVIRRYDIFPSALLSFVAVILALCSSAIIREET